MKHIALALIAIIALSVFATGQAYAQSPNGASPNLVANPSFEQGLTGWSIFDGVGKVSIANDSPSPTCGTHSFLFKKGKHNMGGLWSDVFTVKPSAHYYMSFWYKVTPNTKINAKPNTTYMWWFWGAGVSGQGFVDYDTHGQWKFKSASGFNDPTTESQVDFDFSAYGNGSVQIDCVNITAL